MLLEGIHRSAVETLQDYGYTNVEHLTHAPAEQELLGMLPEYHLVGIRSSTQLTGKVLEKVQKLLAVGCFCIGTNQVDLETAKQKGVAVFNAPFSNTRSVAELVIAEIVMLMRGIPEKNAQAHRGVWQKSPKDAYEVRGKTLGIIGYGHIGSQVGVLAEALGMQIVYYDTENKLSFGNARQLKKLADVLKVADVVTLHVPDVPQTRNMIGFDELRTMKKGAHLINAARGKVVQIDALVEALNTKHIGGAALDVFPSEPKSKDEAFESPLREFDNVLLTPHIGGSTMEAQENIGKEVALKLVQYCDAGSTVSSVNFPEVSLPSFQGKHRFLHVHKNQAGVLASINKVFSKSGLNLSGQYLQTNDAIGYVVLDIDTSSEYEDKAILRELEQIPGTIRTRVLY